MAKKKTRDGASENPLGDPILDISGALRDASVALTQALRLRVLGDMGLDEYMADLLVRLARAPGGQLQGVSIARELTINPARTSRLIDRAEERGFVIRLPDPTDRRAQLVTLTRLGNQVADDFGRLLVPVLAEIAAELNDDERGALIALLRRYEAAANRTAEFQERSRGPVRKAI